ncbi:MAG: hypothetical protein KGL45_14985 [Gammaproteobacteria bacterium]|nr:hypothetical protein [Gammaproteobacteria bacterium]
MSELRWTLLILGVVFIAALSWWERRRPRQAFAPRLRDASLPHPEPLHGEAQVSAGPGPATAGEPWIGEAGLSDVVSSDLALPGADHARLEPAVPGPLEELPTLIIPDAERCRALEAAWTEQPSEPTLIDPEPADTAAASVQVSEAQPSEPQPSEPQPAEPEHEIPGAEGVGAVRIVEAFAGGEVPPEPLVEWPPEESRRILALRLVAPQAERFPGRALRLALAAEGFLLGKFAIFHKPDEANRAVLSAASLTRPGAFELETMDSQRYGGLSLFAVLPGPKAPPQAFEELLATARNLNERLQGALQDERGGPLTLLRVTSIRESLRVEAAAVQAAAAHEA